jgi:hypothetical protein
MTTENKFTIHGIKGVMMEAFLKDGTFVQKWSAQRIIKEGNKRFKATISLSLENKTLSIFTFLFVYKRSWDLIKAGFACEEVMKFFPELAHLAKWQRNLDYKGDPIPITDIRMRKELERAGFLWDTPAPAN